MQSFIDNPDDPRVTPYFDLPGRSPDRGTATFVVEGRWLVQRLLASGLEVESILCLASHQDEFAELRADIPVYLAERAVLEQIVGFDFHRGILACARRPAARSLWDCLGEPARQDASLVCVCSAVCDQQNLGGVIRNCLAFGVNSLLIDAACADSYSRRAMRVSAGAALTLPIFESTDLPADLLRLRQDLGYQLIAAVLDDAAVPLPAATRSPNTAVLFGNEGHGLPSELVDLCYQRVTLPMRGGVDSLNVAVASGIFLHHFQSEQ